jgi:uncharacterized protein (DUF488 family)
MLSDEPLAVHNVPMPAGKNFTAYTIGYEGMTIGAFIAALRAQRIAHLVDIRELALSRKKGFSKTALSEHLERVGIRYSHVRALGCPKPIRDQYRVDGNWKRYSRAFAAYLESQAPAIRELIRTMKTDRCCLMCFEADFTLCHRSLVAHELGGTIVHLTAYGPVAEEAAEVA